MRVTPPIEKKRNKAPVWYWYASILIAIASIAFVLVSSRRTPKALEETVALDTPRRAVIPTGTPVAIPQALPVQERDIEVVGDRIAETILYLKKKQTSSALKAVRQAQLATTHALAARNRLGGGENELEITLSELEMAERAIQRGGSDEATKQLIVIERRLDTLGH